MLPAAAAKVGAFKNEMKGAIMIKPYNRPPGEGKQANLAALAEMHPLLVLAHHLCPAGKHVTGFSGRDAPLQIQFLCHPGGETLLSVQLLDP